MIWNRLLYHNLLLRFLILVLVSESLIAVRFFWVDITLIAISIVRSYIQFNIALIAFWISFYCFDLDLLSLIALCACYFLFILFWLRLTALCYLNITLIGILCSLIALYDVILSLCDVILLPAMVYCVYNASCDCNVISSFVSILSFWVYIALCDVILTLCCFSAFFFWVHTSYYSLRYVYQFIAFFFLVYILRFLIS